MVSTEAEKLFDTIEHLFKVRKEKGKKMKPPQQNEGRRKLPHVIETIYNNNKKKSQLTPHSMAKLLKAFLQSGTAHGCPLCCNLFTGQWKSYPR